MTHSLRAHSVFVLAVALAGLSSPRPALDPVAGRGTWMAEGNQAAAFFGQSVAAAGDVNGDGYPDVIVGAPDYDNGQLNGGRAFVYDGSAAGLGRTPSWTAGWDQTLAQFGYSVGTAGDVNGDGFDDVIVGCPDCRHGERDEGSAFVYYGSASGPAIEPGWIVQSDQAEALLGLAVGTAGDVNGDGFDDVIVGCPHCRNGQYQEGLAFVYQGSSVGLSTTPDWTADQGGGLLGWSVGTAGDVNGDGYADVIVGAPAYSNPQFGEGAAFVYEGSAAGLPGTPSRSIDSDQAYSYFGGAVGTAGDVNGDGFDDVIVGAKYYIDGQISEGAAFAYEGSSAGVSGEPDWMAESDQEYALFGFSVGTEGDVDGDGYDDAIVGSYLFSDGQTGEGKAFAYRGSPAGLDTTPYWTPEGDQVRAWFGYAVGTAGDVNDDGYSEVIVGASAFDHGQMDEGVALVYRGGSP